MCNAAFEELKKSGDAIVINISATLHYGATWYQVHASAAKAAIDRLPQGERLARAQRTLRKAGAASANAHAPH